MTKPAFIVEGDLEQKFIQLVCSGCPVRKINCNGDSVKIELIAKRVGTLGRLLHKRHSPIIVVFDREQRTETIDEIENIFRESLRPELIEVPVIIGIPDRDIENWILADIEIFAEKSGAERELFPPNYEGEKGKTIIKKYIGRNRSYVETIDGVKWLKACRPSIMRSKSLSFNKFSQALDDISCWWLKEQHFDNLLY